MKKCCSILLMLSLLAALLAGCTQTDPQEPSENTDAQTQTETPPTTGSATQTDDVPDPADEDTTAEIAVVEEWEAVLYLPNGDASAFETVTETTKASPQGLVDALIAHGALPECTEVLSFFLDDHGVETQEGETVSYTPGDTLTIELDLSQTFADAASSTGTAGETMLLGSLVNTMLEAYQADEVLLTCQGEVLETGHNVYDLPLTFFAEDQAG